MQTKSFPEYDERVSWKVPTLFNNDWVALTMAQRLNSALPKPFFATAYGCVSCAWAGGRHARMGGLSEDGLRRYFEAYAEAGATCALTFSRPDAGDYVGDAYANLALGLLEEYGGSAIVVDGRLARHIRATHPGVGLIASYNRVMLDRARGFDGMDEESYYRKLLERYDEVVVRCEALLEGGIAERLVDVADRVQLIVNQQCVPDCPVVAEHILGIERVVRAMEAGETFEFPGCSQRLDGSEQTVYVPSERRRELADMGFRKFKLQGRNASAQDAVMFLASNILGIREAGAAPEGLRSVLVAAGVMDSLGTPIELAADLPSR